ncbi:MAG TPA: hypothetical protein VFV63_08745, partial [Ilumatobacteraceae bacterium]|nr:hypothetical protein [Ilumatobacteraceae bacterium]
MIVVVACLVTGLPIPPFASGGHVVAADCSHTWAPAGGSFADSAFGNPANWIENVAPTSGSNVCFSTGDTTFFGLERVIETIDVADGATVVLNAGTLDLNSNSSLGGVFVANGGRIRVGKDVTVPAGRRAGAIAGQAGTIASSTGAVLTIDGALARDGGNQLNLDLDVVNNGDVSVDGALALGPGRTFANTGTVTVAPGANLTTTTITAARFHNTGVVEFSGDTRGPDAGGVRGLQFDNDGTVRVLGGDVALVTTGTGRGTWEIGTVGSDSCAADIGKTPTPGARLFLRPSPTVTMTGGSVTGPGCLNVWNGTADVGSDVVWAPGATEIFSATLRVAGDRTLPQLRLGNGGKLEVVAGTATMRGHISQTTPGQSVRFGGDGRLVVPPAFSVVHELNNGFDIAESLDVVVEGSMALTGAVTLRDSSSLVSKGAWSVGPGSTIAPAPGTLLRNEGTLTVDAGTGSIMFGGGANFDNAGTVRLVRGTLDMRVP